MMGMRKMRVPALTLLTALLLCGCGAEKKKNPCRNPNYVQAMKEQAVALYGKEDYINALKSIKDAEACKPKDADLYYWMGLIYFQREKYYEAIDSFEKSLAIDPKYTTSRMALGLVYLKLERWDEAISQFEIASRDDYFERPWEAFNNMGWAYLQKGEAAGEPNLGTHNLSLAEVNFNQAVHLNDKYCAAHSNLGELYAKQGAHEKAVLSYQRAISLCPTNYARPHFLLALEYGHFGYFDKACAELAVAAGIPNAPEAAKAQEYKRLYNCPNVLSAQPGP